MTWTSTTESLDSLIRDYLFRRGFNSTLKSFENDLKTDKEKGFKAEKVLQQILSFVSLCDLDSLYSYWNHLDTRIFSRFEQAHMATVKKMENNLYRFYLVTCMQNGKRKECFEFFEKFSQDLSNLSEWKDWFAFPFTAQPENSKTFSNYFTKAWTDTFLASLHNFLAVTFACMPPPQLYNIINQDKMKIEQLEHEIEVLREKVADVSVTSSNVFQKVSTQNYVKSLGAPGNLSEPSVAVSQPQKKKTLGFPFSSKRNTSSTSIKPKSNPKVSARAVDIPQTPEVSTQPPVAQQDVSTTQKNKKLSGYQMQRKELFGNASTTQKQLKGFSSSKDISSSPPVSAVTTSVPSLTSTPNVSSSNSITIASPQSSAAISISPKVCESETNSDSISFISETDVNLKTSNGNIDLSVTPPGDIKKRTHILLSKDEYHEHHSAIIQGRFNTTGETIASCDKDGIVKIWQYEPNLKTIATIMSRSPYLSLEWNKTSNNLLLLGSATGNLRLYDAITKQMLQDITCTHSLVSHIACSPKGNQFATSCLSSSSQVPSTNQSAILGRLELWNLTGNSAQLSSTLVDSKISGNIQSLAFHPKSDTLVCGGSTGDITIFDTLSGKLIINKPLHDGSVYSLEVTDQNIYTLGADGKLLGLDLRDMSQPINFPIHPMAAGPFEVSGFGGYRQVHKPSGGKLFAYEPDGHHILTCDGNSCPIYSIDFKDASLKKEKTLHGHKSPVVSVDWISAFNCGHCLTGSMDGRIHVTTLLHQ